MAKEHRHHHEHTDEQHHHQPKDNDEGSAHMSRADARRLADEDESGGEGAKALAGATSIATGPVVGGIEDYSHHAASHDTTRIIINKGANRGIVTGMRGHITADPEVTFVIVEVRARESEAVVDMEQAELKALGRGIVIHGFGGAHKKPRKHRRHHSDKGIHAKITTKSYPDLWIDKGSADGIKSGMKVRIQFEDKSDVLTIYQVNEHSCSVYWGDEYKEHGGTYPVSDDVTIIP
jgi:hypothetical protein